jgi:putative sigma-54 modulation protein
MNINIKATQIELTEAITNYVYKRLEPLEKFLGGKEGVNVLVEVGKSTNHHNKGDIFRAEVHMIGAGIDVYAVKETNDLYAAIDVVESEIKRELKSLKGKQSRTLRDGQRRIKDMMKGFPWMGRGK